MPAVFTGRWTRAQILTQALNRAGTQKIAHLARDRLNRLLEELYTQWEWPFLYTEYLFTMPATNQGGPARFVTFALPATFLKTEDEESLRILTQDGVTQGKVVLELDRGRFLRAALPFDQEADAPRLWYVDYAQRFGVVWPRPLAALGMVLLYKSLPADVAIGTGGKLGAASDPDTVAYDLDVPLFPWGGYLAIEMEAWARQHEHDPQWQAAKAESMAAFDNIRSIALPRGSQSDVLPLDPGTFDAIGFRDEFQDS